MTVRSSAFHIKAIGELGLHTLGAPLEELPGAERVGRCLRGIPSPEHVGKKLGDESCVPSLALRRSGGLVGAITFPGGRCLLKGQHYRGAEEKRDEAGSGAQPDPVPARELLRPIGPRSTSCENREPRPIAFQLVEQGVDRSVPLVGLLSQTFQDDRVQIAIERAPEPVGVGGACLRDMFGCHPSRCLSCSAIDRPAGRSRGTLGQILTDRLLQHIPARSAVTKRAVAAQQPVQDDAERV